MAAWAELTQSQRDEVLDEMTAAREWSGMMARLCSLGRAIAAKHSGNVETILASLDDGEIPVYDAGRGEEQLSKADLSTLVGYAIVSSEVADASPGSYNTNYHRGLYVRAAGIYNTLQQGRV